MAGVDNATASLCIMGRELDPDDVTILLDCAPTRSFRAGDVHSARHPEQRWKHGGWILETALDRHVDLGAQIVDLLDRVTDDVAVWQQITDRFSARISCGIFMDHENEGFGLGAATLARLAIYGLPVDFDLYGPTRDDEGPSVPD